MVGPGGKCQRRAARKDFGSTDAIQFPFAESGPQLKSFLIYRDYLLAHPGEAKLVQF